jgi:tripartite-type tricarboxylate transporter receptor subunit TctC
MVAKGVFLAVLAAMGFVALDQAQAKSFPDRLIKIVVPYPPGGPSDWPPASSPSRCPRA